MQLTCSFLLLYFDCEIFNKRILLEHINLFARAELAGDISEKGKFILCVGDTELSRNTQVSSYL